MIVELTVVPKSPALGVSMKDGKVKIRLTGRPEKGEANAELVKALSRALGGRAVRIVSGHASRHKRIEVDATEAEWQAFLSNMLKNPI